MKTRNAVATNVTWPNQTKTSPHRAARFALLIILAGSLHGYAQTVPNDPDVGCSVLPPTVNGWFKSGNVAVNGAVNPANSIAFPDSPNCSFYQWSYQMFLWLTSPTPPIYGAGGAHVFESSAFFSVSPPDQNFRRKLIPHQADIIRNFDVLTRQVGPHRLPLIVDKQGRVFEIEPPPKQIPPLRIRSSSGQLMEISRVQLEEGGKKVFLDKAGKTVAPRFFTDAAPKKALDLKERKIPLTIVARVQQFLFDRIPIFVDSLGNVIDVELGQADGASVLIAQNKSLIYYDIAVSEVFAYFRTMQPDPPNQVSPNLLFPTTQAELNDIATFASGHGRTFVDPEALAIELKTSWIEATGVSNPNDYITMTATIPIYTPSDSNTWVPNGQKTTKLAMVGMHIVGSTKGHPEMIWATFEHIANAPNDIYSYRNASGGITQVPPSPATKPDTSGTWLFCASGSQGPFNQPRNRLDANGNIVAVSTTVGVGPDNIIRKKAWGAAVDVSPNFRDAPASNSEIISINNAVRGLLAGDVRGNYIMTGATWMIAFATGPNFNFTNVGTSKMNNATMETFKQGPENKASGTLNCFSCHGGNTTGVSHIFADLKPLF